MNRLYFEKKKIEIYRQPKSRKLFVFLKTSLNNILKPYTITTIVCLCFGVAL